MASSRQARPRTIALDTLPGHYIRRLQQIAVALFLQETEGLGVTPVQYAALQCIANAPGMDQRTLAGAIAFDTSTIAGVIDRLEARGWVTRTIAPDDRRARRLALTDAGQAALAAVQPGMKRTQQRILAPLSRDERAEFVRMLQVLVETNNEASRAPGETARAAVS
jgi:DNA-binding MarR family transcriptional regulator